MSGFDPLLQALMAFSTDEPPHTQGPNDSPGPAKQQDSRYDLKMPKLSQCLSLGFLGAYLQFSADSSEGNTKQYG